MHPALRIVAMGTQRRRAPPEVFGSRLLVWLDRSDLSVQWQDSARTTPAVVGSVVGSIQNKGTLNFFQQQATGGSRGILTSDATGTYILRDGLDDSEGSSATLDLTSYNQLTVIAGVRKDSDAAAARVYEFGTTTTSQNGSFGSQAPQSATATWTADLRGTATCSAANAGVASPAARVATVFYDLTQTTRDTAIVMRHDGAAFGPPYGLGTSVNPAGTVFSNYSFFTGRRNNASSPFTGAEYQMLIIAGIVTGSELTYIEKYVGAKMGKSL